MARNYTSLYYHVIFSTRGREPLLRRDIEERVWGYLDAVARQHHIRPLAVGGGADHVHMLLSIPPSLSVEPALQDIKEESAEWIRTHILRCNGFRWQQGYSAFTVSRPQLAATEQLIRHQRRQHRVKSFLEEYKVLLNRAGVEYDARLPWD